MEPSDIPGPVQVFLRTYIESYEELELLLLVRSRATDWCSGAALGPSLATAPSRQGPLANVDEVLARLRQRGLIEAIATNRARLSSSRPSTSWRAATTTTRRA
jgi:hypothetical protein